MEREKRKMILGAMMFFPAGEQISSWRHPKAEAEGLLNFDYYKRIVQTAERGKFDLFFYADELYVWDDFESSVKYANSIRPEPFTLLSALSVVTNNIGLGATISTTYNEPYHIARKLATLDHLSGGRTAWNIVTSRTDEEAQNFGKEKHLLHERRYERAKEFIDVTEGLWDSWEDDALLFDKESGHFANINKLHYLQHKGPEFSVRGPLNVARPPQGYPVLIQAGASEAGKELAAATAEVVFAPKGTLEEGMHLYQDIKGRMAKYGRSDQHLKILPGIMPVIGRTKEEAEEKLAAIDNLIPWQLGLDLLSHEIGEDLSAYPLDEPLPFLPDIESANKSKSKLLAVRKLMEKENVTLRQLCKRFNSRGIAGTPEQIADQLEERFVNKAADGFNIAFPYLPGALDDFVDLVVPELQRRGLYKTEYSGKTLRENLGLKRPTNRFTTTNVN